MNWTICNENVCGTKRRWQFQLDCHKQNSLSKRLHLFWFNLSHYAHKLWTTTWPESKFYGRTNIIDTRTNKEMPAILIQLSESFWKGPCSSWTSLSLSLWTLTFHVPGAVFNRFDFMYKKIHEWMKSLQRLSNYKFFYSKLFKNIFKREISLRPKFNPEYFT